MQAIDSALVGQGNAALTQSPFLLLPPLACESAGGAASWMVEVVSGLRSRSSWQPQLKCPPERKTCHADLANAMAPAEAAEVALDRDAAVLGAESAGAAVVSPDWPRFAL